MFQEFVSEILAILGGALGFTAMGMFLVVLNRICSYESDSACNTRFTKENFKNVLKNLRRESKKLLLVSIFLYIFFVIIPCGILYAP